MQIQNYKPMWANMRARFVIDGPHVELDRIEIDTDGAKTVARGSVELGKRWPEQSYDFESRVQFPRMGDIFFSDQNWDLTGDGDVIGRFHLFKGGHDLSGTFKSDVLGWNDYRFPELSGALHWTPKALRRHRTRARNSSAATPQFTYSIKPLGQKDALDVALRGQLRRTPTSPRSAIFRSGPACVWPARWSGHNLLEWPTGRFVERRDEGSATVVPPPGVQTMTRRLARPSGRSRTSNGDRSRPCRFPTHVPIAADVTYRFTADELELEPSYFATEQTHVTFQGTHCVGRAIALRVSRRQPTTGRKATRCWPASSRTSARRATPSSRSAGAASSTA